MAGGTVWSRSPEMISSGPRSGFLLSTFASVQGLRFAAAAWKTGSPAPGTANFSYSDFASSSSRALANLLVRERHGSMAVRGVLQHGRSRSQRGDRKRQHAPERCRRDGHGDGREPTTGQDLRQQPAEAVADHRGFAFELEDHRLEVVRDLADGLAGEDLRMGLRLLDRVRIVGPARTDRAVIATFDQLRPPVPATREQPQAVHEHHRLLAGTVRTIDLLRLVLRHGSFVDGRRLLGHCALHPFVRCGAAIHTRRRGGSERFS
jgi:hypothetical protein